MTEKKPRTWCPTCGGPLWREALDDDDGMSELVCRVCELLRYGPRYSAVTWAGREDEANAHETPFWSTRQETIDACGAAPPFPFTDGTGASPITLTDQEQIEAVLRLRRERARRGDLGYDPMTGRPPFRGLNVRWTGSFQTRTNPRTKFGALTGIIDG